MYGNHDFMQRPPPRIYGNRFARPNLDYPPNYRFAMPQNFYHPQSANAASANMNYTNHNPLFNNIDNEESSLIAAAIEMREQDEREIQNFLKENEQKFVGEEKKNNNEGDRELKISEAHCALVSVCKLNYELEKMCNDIKENRDIPESEWCAKIVATEKKRVEILEAVGKLEDDKLIAKVKRSIEKRKKKRLREKKQRVLRKAKKQAANERKIKLHGKADAWIKDKQDIIEKEKQEVNMRKDADLVLAEVRGRRNDARKFLALLHELQNLRRIQVNIARARGEHLSAAADEAFSNIIDKLVEQWTALDREYSIEEQGLKLMLKTDNEQKIEKQKRSIFDDWENTLFGRKLPPVDSFQRNVHAFVTRRAAWDKYMSYDELASPIPIGWVMPESPSSAAWQKYLKKE